MVILWSLCGHGLTARQVRRQALTAQHGDGVFHRNHLLFVRAEAAQRDGAGFFLAATDRCYGDELSNFSCYYQRR